MKYPNNPNGIPTRDLPFCRAVPQPTALLSTFQVDYPPIILPFVAI